MFSFVFFYALWHFPIFSDIFAVAANKFTYIIFPNMIYVTMDEIDTTVAWRVECEEPIMDDHDIEALDENVLEDFSVSHWLWDWECATIGALGLEGDRLGGTLIVVEEYLLYLLL